MCVNRANSKSMLDAFSTTICVAIKRLSTVALSTLSRRDGAATAHIAMKNNGRSRFSNATEISGGTKMNGHLGSIPVRNSSRHISCSASVCGRKVAAGAPSELASELSTGVDIDAERGDEDSSASDTSLREVAIGAARFENARACVVSVAGAVVVSLLEGISVLFFDAFCSIAPRSSADAPEDSPTLRKSVTRLSILPSSCAILGAALWDFWALRRRMGSDGSHCLLSR